MNPNYQAYKNIAAQEGRIDPTTSRDAKRSAELCEKIEHWFAVYNNPGNLVTKLNAERKIKIYAKQYKKHTGEWYVRNCTL